MPGAPESKRQASHINWMVEAICLQNEMITWVDSFVVARNKGGKYVAFYSKYLEKRVMAVYEERWRFFPESMTNLMRSAAEKNFEAPSSRAQAEDMGLTYMPSVEILRIKKVSAKNPDGKWVFHRVLRIIEGDEGDEGEIPEPSVETSLTNLIESMYPDPTIRQNYVMSVLKAMGALSMEDVSKEKKKHWIKKLNEKKGGSR